MDAGAANVVAAAVLASYANARSVEVEQVAVAGEDFIVAEEAKAAALGGPTAIEDGAQEESSSEEEEIIPASRPAKRRKINPEPTSSNPQDWTLWLKKLGGKLPVSVIKWCENRSQLIRDPREGSIGQFIKEFDWSGNLGEAEPPEETDDCT